MGAISALSTTGRTLKRNGVLFAVALVVTLVSIIPSGSSVVLPPMEAAVLSFLLSGLLFFVAPFFFGGLLSMASEAIGGVTRFETFVAGGKENYLQLLGAMVLFAIVFGAFAAVVTIGLTVTAIFAVGINSAGAAGPMGGSAGAVGTVALLGLVGLFVVLLPVFFLQFYAAAIVVSDLGVVDSFKRSVGIVRQNLVSTLGYSVIVGFVGLVAGVAGSAVSTPSGYGRFGAIATVSPELGPGLFAGAFLVSFLVSTVVAAFSSVYQVAFYEDCLDSLD